MQTCQLAAGARARLPLFRTDADRRALLARLEVALRAALLAYCLMDTHVHVVAEGPEEHLLRWFEAALTVYARDFARAHRDRDVVLLRGPPKAHPVPPDPAELERTIYYVHENPVDTKVPMVERAIDYRWSSARAFAGLSLAGGANVTRTAWLLAADDAESGRPGLRRLPRWLEPHPLADLAPSAAPSARPTRLVAAAAEVFGIDPADLAGPSRAPAVTAARTAYVHLGELESYSHSQLAVPINRTRVRVTQLAGGTVDSRAVRVARTLVRDTRLARRLPSWARNRESAESETA